MADSSNWTIDKKIPLALVGVLISQIFFFGWFLSNHESRIASLETKNGEMIIMMQSINERMTEITLDASETKVHLQYLSASIKEIEKILKEGRVK